MLRRRLMRITLANAESTWPRRCSVDNAGFNSYIEDTERSFSTMPTDGLLLLARLRDYYAEHGVLPSYATLSTLAGIRAKSWAHTLVAQLREERFLDVTPDKRLKPGPRFFERDLFDSIRAGLPEQASEDSSSVVTIDRYLIPRPSKTSLVRVSGESMKEAGILAGDLAVIEWRTNAKVGDIVAAMVDGELTLKYLARDKGGYYLLPANDAYAPIRAKGRLEISGVMVGLVRRL
jgi:SOS-response transcriptional repressor LexA